MNQPLLKVFISHATVDTWVARQLADHIHRCGHMTFLDQVNLSHGDDFEQEILRQWNGIDARQSTPDELASQLVQIVERHKRTA